MRTIESYTYKCPCCGSPLKYDGFSQKLSCKSCDNEFDAESLEAVQRFEAEDAGFEQLNWNMGSGQSGEGFASNTYVCQSCGAELMTDETTTATECAYCGSPIVLATNLNEGVHPEYVLPFKIDEETARKKFHNYFHGKKLIPNVFETSKNRIAEIRRLYVPYWLFSCTADAHITYNATRVSVRRMGNREETRTRHYLVRRTGRLSFEGIPVDGSEKLDNRITESLEPYDFSEAIPFTPATLSGSLADRPDVDEAFCRERANERLRHSTCDTFRNTVVGFTTVVDQSCSIHIEDGTGVPVLLPIWLIRTQKEVKGEIKDYTFAINGQTGELTCDIPFSRGKAAKWFFGLTAGICAAGYGILTVLSMLGVIGGGLA